MDAKRTEGASRTSRQNGRAWSALVVAAAIATAAAPLIALTSTPAQAQASAAKPIVDAAKASGAVGEQADGFLGVVSTADPKVRGALAEINAGRAEAYRAIAARTGVSPEAAGQATARELFGRLAPGAMYKGVDGDWRRK